MNWAIRVRRVDEIKIKLLDRARSLSDNPHKGQFETNLKRLDKGNRRLVEGYFKIIYRIEEEVVYITDFFETSQDSTPLVRTVDILRTISLLR